MFIHLRVHSPYSLLEGALRLPDLLDSCQTYTMPAVALTDTNNLFGAMDFTIKARQKGIQPLLGAQVSFYGEASSFVLLVQSKTGYVNLMSLVSALYTVEKPSFSLLEKYHEGLLLLAGPESPLGQLYAQGKDGTKMAQALARLFKDRFYIELMRHPTPPPQEEALLDLAYDLGLPLVATNNCFFLKREDFEAEDALLCIADGAYLSQEDRRRVTQEHSFKTPEEMVSLFSDLPEAIANTVVVAQRCAFMLEVSAPLIPRYKKRTEEAATALRSQANQGLKRRLSILPPAYQERLDFELSVIEATGFCDYFLIVADFVQWAKHQGIAVGPGRGSGVGSLVSWSLFITELDPLRFGLLFERFLNPERVSMPDFDIDFCPQRRDEVFKYLQNEYGDECVAHIITFGKLQARAVLRDVGRVLEMPYGKVDRICRLVPINPAAPPTLAQALKSEPLLAQERESDTDVARLLELSLRLEGLYRHASTHAGGVVIADRPLSSMIPLYKDPRSPMPVTQFSMAYVEQAGLIKFDLLGLKTLTILQESMALQGKTPQDIPLEDPKTFEMMGRGDTIGVFQLESHGMRDVLRQLRPKRIEDIIAINALYRPGPMENLPGYIKRVRGEEAPDYMHPALKSVLEETLGIPIYQEQVMQMAQELAGYPLGQADLLRRAMGKKKKDEMDKHRALFCEGAWKKHKLPASEAHRIFDQMQAFAGYGFNKSHAAAYALLAYQTGWVKAHHPVAFIVASMNQDVQNTERLSVLHSEARRLGVPLFPPDINASSSLFTPETKEGHGGVRYALAAIKGVGQGAAEHIVSLRTAHGPFSDIFSLVGRCGPGILNKRALENLIKAGVFDSVHPHRRELFLACDQLIKYSALGGDGRQGTLFHATPKLATHPPWDVEKKLVYEYEAVGMYLSEHPLSAYKESLEHLKVVPMDKITPQASPFSVVGIVEKRRIRSSVRGKVGFVTLSDATGAREVTVFQEGLEAAQGLFEPGTLVFLTVSAQERTGSSEERLVVQKAHALEDILMGSCTAVEIVVEGSSVVPSLAAILKRHTTPGGGVCRLTCTTEGTTITMTLQQGYTLSGTFIGRLRRTEGVLRVRTS